MGGTQEPMFGGGGAITTYVYVYLLLLYGLKKRFVLKGPAEKAPDRERKRHSIDRPGTQDVSPPGSLVCSTSTPRLGRLPASLRGCASSPDPRDPAAEIAQAVNPSP